MAAAGACATGLTLLVVLVSDLTGDRAVDDLSERWSELVRAPAARIDLRPPQLVVKHSEYRRLLDPLVDFVMEIAQRDASRTVAVVIPELVEPRWYQHLLHGHSAAFMKRELRARGEPRVVIIDTPWYLRDWLPERRFIVRASTARVTGQR
jgi:hypothetical protein